MIYDTKDAMKTGNEKPVFMASFVSYFLEINV